MGESIMILKNAISAFSDFLEEITVSSVYQTKPQDCLEQNDFYNLAVSGFFQGSPGDLLVKIQCIEALYGRNRNSTIPKGPRTLDIDIVLFGNSIVQEPFLVIPHERMKNRQFVLVPLVELSDEYSDPVTGLLFRDILSQLPDQGVKKVGNLYGK